MRVGFVLRKNPDDFRAAEVDTVNWKIARQEVIEAFGGRREVVRCLALIIGGKSELRV